MTFHIGLNGEETRSMTTRPHPKKQPGNRGAFSFLQSNIPKILGAHFSKFPVTFRSWKGIIKLIAVFVKRVPKFRNDAIKLSVDEVKLTVL